MKTYDQVDKILCHYRHKGGRISIEREGGRLSLAVCVGYDMPTTIIRRKNDSGYDVRKYGECPKKYARKIYED